MAKMIELTKAEAKALLVALDWCDNAFGIGKSQRNIVNKIAEVYPELFEED